MILVLKKSCQSLKFENVQKPNTGHTLIYHLEVTKIIQTLEEEGITPSVDILNCFSSDFFLNSPL